VTVDLTVSGDRIMDFGQEVKACALGQASAAILGARAVGLTEAEIRRGRDQLLAMLKENGPPPDAPFAELEVLSPARDYRNRHTSIMLAFDATLDALAEVRARTQA
jgi:NifU-like protein involved in Fe-S cluster formation